MRGGSPLCTAPGSDVDERTGELCVWGRKVEIHVVNDGIDIVVCEKVAASLPAGENLHRVRRPPGKFAGLPNWGEMALTTYHKLTLGEWLPAHVGKAISLDCDALVLEDQSE